MKKSKTLIVIVGPTASGKTSLALEVAKRFHTEVISADSRQIYKELTIGTAKPTEEEMQGVKHHFVNSHSIKDDYSIGKFEQDALKVADSIFKHSDYAVMAGGSGLYVKVVCEGMDEVPETNPEIRQELTHKLYQEGMEALAADLKQKDPEFYKEVDLFNPQRVIRALEVYYSTGQPFSSFRTGERKERGFNIIKIGVKREREEPYKRIDLRMDVMIAHGLFEEAASLKEYQSHNALQTVGYKEIFDFMDGYCDKEETIRLLKRNSRRYAKRQMTWFNKDEEIKWIEPDAEQVIEYIEERLRLIK